MVTIVRKAVCLAVTLINQVSTEVCTCAVRLNLQESDVGALQQFSVLWAGQGRYVAALGWFDQFWAGTESSARTPSIIALQSRGRKSGSKHSIFTRRFNCCRCDSLDLRFECLFRNRNGRKSRQTRRRNQGKCETSRGHRGDIVLVVCVQRAAA